VGFIVEDDGEVTVLTAGGESTGGQPSSRTPDATTIDERPHLRRWRSR
jgi:hypothetical protein